jgi:transcriptional regulator with XRE-family HTH domain
MSIADCNFCATVDPDGMKVVDSDGVRVVDPDGMKVPPGADRRPLHRLATVRRNQGVPRRQIARELNIDVEIVKQQEEETSDLPLSTLYKWQRLLDVPVAELLVDDDAPLSPPVMKRAQMVRIMKTVLSIIEQSSKPLIRRMAQNLVNQLVELMPELKDLTPWNSVGQRRRVYEYGRAAQRTFSIDGLVDLIH